MIVKTNFNFRGELLEFSLDTDQLDRNYSDENYAYWIVKRNGCYHEINISKDDDGSFRCAGTVYTWFAKGSFEDGKDADCIADVSFVFCTKRSSVKLESMLSQDSYDELTEKIKEYVGEQAFHSIFPGVKEALENGDGDTRHKILIEWLGMDSVRVCSNCGEIMDDGWYLGPHGYACSDDCCREIMKVSKEEFDRYSIYLDDVKQYLEDNDDSRNPEDIPDDELADIITDIVDNLDEYYYTQWY